MNFILVIPVLIGWLAALLVNYLADVLPATRRLSQPVCRHCQKPVRWRNYLLMSKTECEHPRGLRTWFTQGLGVALSVYIWIVPPPKLGYTLGLILLIYLALIFVIDIEHRLVLHPTSLFGAALTLILGVLLHGIIPTLIGGAAGFGIMFILYYLGLLFVRFMSRRRTEGTDIEEGDALGFGDVILAGVLGFLLGWPVIWLGLLTAILAGGAFSLVLILGMLALKRYQAFAAIPYAPFLILGAVFFIYVS
ncbi:MAG: A24 family peptidase [Anaerolineales bacterium]|nr:A24 family peptidase [Anaerolineales bacterium]